MSNLAIQRWLEKTVSGRGDVTSAIVVMSSRDKTEHSTHWPSHEPVDEGLLMAAQAQIAGTPAAGKSDKHIVTRPVQSQGKVIGALAMRLSDKPVAANEPTLRAVAATPAAAAASLRSEELQLKLIQMALAAPRFDQTVVGLATELATLLSCTRVFIGMSVRQFVQVKGVSHGTGLGQEQALARLVGAVMDEAVDQGASVLFPQRPDDRPRITLAHAELAKRDASLCVLTVPMFNARQPVGAITFERPKSARFDADTMRRIEALVSALAPVLRLQFGREQSVLQRLRAAFDLRMSTFTPRQKAGVALGVLGAVGAAGLLLASQWTYQVSAPTRLEGQVQRAVVAPVDGFIKSVHVRPGDAVREGQLLAELNDEDLRLERRRWEAEVARYENTYAEAQAKEDRTQLVIADSRMAESRAQLALVDQQLTRTQMLAPFDALVIKGDLSQQLGAPVKRGDLLLTLTPSREFRVMIELDERDVGQVQPGARGAVTLSALADRSFELVIDRVMPVAKAEGGRNLFEAEAHLVAATGADISALRPGLQGVARVNAGQRSAWWLASHRVLDWLRFQWWSWLG